MFRERNLNLTELSSSSVLDITLWVVYFCDMTLSRIYEKAEK